MYKHLSGHYTTVPSIPQISLFLDLFERELLRRLLNILINNLGANVATSGPCCSSLCGALLRTVIVTNATLD